MVRTERQTDFNSRDLPSSRSRIWNRAVPVLLTFLVLILCGCEQKPLAYDLSQFQAREILATLSRNGMHAEMQKETGGRGHFTVKIDAADYVRAIELLQERGLPQPERVGVDELLAPQGLIPSSRETENLRLDYALAGELEGLLRNDPAVSAVKVVVRKNARKPDEPVAVSATFQLRVGTTMSEADSRKLIQQSIPGVAQEQITILTKTEIPSLTAAAENTSSIQDRLVSFLFFWNVPASQYAGLAFTLIFLVVTVALSSLGIGFLSGRFSVERKGPGQALPMISSKKGGSLQLTSIEEDDD